MDQSLAALRRFVRPREATEQCDLCSAEVASEHAHLFEPPTRQIKCACEACSILFSNRGDGRLVRVPRRVRYLENFRITDEQWNGLMLPIQLAFIFKSSAELRVVAMYPSPAGATESLLPLDTWTEIEKANPQLETMLTDVEALLVNRTAQHRDHFIVPIDECYKLVGLIRLKWHGLSGGSEVRREIDRFFESLRTSSAKKGAANA
ncbi:MAG TPA: DUF5947 family protein [Pyrinomonadaceae bacterium]|nr:DUF5947 family protein [Pyrinomonadaceae bacterium]